MVTYRNIELPEQTRTSDLKAAADDYRAICLTTMGAIVDRYEATDDYPYVDTKLNLVTGEEFADDDPVRGKSAIYGWIQGRGLLSPAMPVGCVTRAGMPN